MSMKLMIETDRQKDRQDHVLSQPDALPKNVGQIVEFSLI